MVQDIEAAQQAVQAASDVDAATITAEDLRHQAATAIADVARMLRAEGPAAAIAEVRCAVSRLLFTAGAHSLCAMLT